MVDDTRNMSVPIPGWLLAEVELAVERGDVPSVDLFIADALHHELLRVRSDAADRDALKPLLDEPAQPEEPGIGWEGLMQQPSDAPVPKGPESP